MSLASSIETLETVLKAVTVFDNPILGIQDDADQGPAKRMYIGDPNETFEYEDLHAAEGPTSSVAEVSILMVFHQEMVTPEDRTLFKYMEDKAQEVRRLIQTGNAPVTGAFKNDGDVGFRAQVSTIKYSFRPTDSKGAVLIGVIIGAYTKS